MPKKYSYRCKQYFARVDIQSECQVRVQCPHYDNEQLITPNYVKGDPHNQAVLIHYDGWNPEATLSSHSLAAFTVSNACMQKSERAGNKMACVYSFVPTSQLHRIKNPHKYDGFFQPLIENLSRLYIDGEKVSFAKKYVDEV